MQAAGRNSRSPAHHTERLRRQLSRLLFRFAAAAATPSCRRNHRLRLAAHREFIIAAYNENIRIVKDAEEICSIYTECSRHTHIPKSRAHCFRWNDEKQMHLTCTVERPGKDEGDLIEALFDCDPARMQAGGLQWAELLDRFVELKLYKSPEGARRRFQKLIANGWLKKQGEYYWPSRP